MWKLRERLKKREEEKQNRPLDPLLPFGLRRGLRGQMFKNNLASMGKRTTDKKGPRQKTEPFLKFLL